ncbi:MAG: hypothetical protein ACE5GZ_12685 [Gammaproteobacteria bacterium]
MNSFEKRYYLQDPGLLQRIRRDLMLLTDTIKLLLYWLIKGHTIRRDYKRAQREGDTLFLEDLFNDKQE